MTYATEHPFYPPYDSHTYDPTTAPDPCCPWCDEGTDEYDRVHHRHDYYVTREGASTRTGDSLAFVFLWDVAELLTALDDENGLSAGYRVPSDIVNPEGWYEDPDDSERVMDEIQQAESALYDAGYVVSWNDGYVISRVVVLGGANRSTFTRTMAQGHQMRLGHKLEGYYVPTSEPGIMRLVRTCCAEVPE